MATLSPSLAGYARQQAVRRHALPDPSCMSSPVPETGAWGSEVRRRHTGS